MAGAITEREIKFLISIKNQTAAGIESFRSDINAIRQEVISLNRAFGSLGTKFSQVKSYKDVREYLKSFQKITKAKYFQNFIKLADSISMVTKSSADSARAMENLEGFIVKTAQAGKILEANSSQVGRLSKFVNELAKSFSQIAGLRLDKLSLISKIFGSINQFSRDMADSSMVIAIERISEKKADLQRVALALKSIARSLSSEKVIAGANAIARIGGIGVGGGGGGGTGGGGGYRMPFIPFYTVSRESAKGLGTAFQIGGEPELGFKTAAEEFVTTFGKTRGKISPSRLGSLVSGRRHIEVDEKASSMMKSIASSRGHILHSIQQFILNDIELKKGIGNFIKEKVYKTKEWERDIFRLARTTRQDYLAMVRRIAAEKGFELDKESMKRFKRAANEINKEIIRWGTGGSSLFEKINSYVRRNAENMEKAFSQMSIQTEKLMGPLEIMKPGFKVSKSAPREALKMFAKSVRFLKKNLRLEQYQEFLLAVKNYGAYLEGTADVVATFGKQLEPLIVDLKTGGAKLYKGNLPYAIAQLGSYQLLAQQQFRLPKLPRAAVYAPGRKPSMFEFTGIDIAGNLESIKVAVDAEEKRQRQIKRTVELKERDLEVTKNITNATKNSVSASKEYHEVNKKISETRRTAGGAGGGEPPIPPGGGGEGDGRFRLPPSGGYGLQARRPLLESKDIQEQIVATSNYIGALTQAYLKQRMLGEAISLTSTRILEYKKVVNETSSAFSKYVTLVDKRNNENNTFIANIEKLNSIMNLHSLEVERSNRAYERMAILVNEMRMRIKGLEGVNAVDIFKIEDPKEFIRVLGGLKGRGLLEHDKVLSRLYDSYEKLALQVKASKASYESFNKEFIVAMQTGESSNEILNSIFNALKNVDSEFKASAGSVATFNEGVELLNRTMANQHRAELVAAVDTKRLSSVFKELDKSFEMTGVKLDDETQSASKLRLGIKALSKEEKLLNDLVDTSAQALYMARLRMDEFRQAAKKSKDGGKAFSKQINAIEKETVQLNEAMKMLDDRLIKTRTNLARLTELQRQRSGRTAEHFRGLVRTTLKGFGDMIKSQAAWVAGYGVMFGAIRGLKSALGSVIEVEHQFARALRVVRSETKKTAEMFKEFITTGLRAMLKFGKTSADVGEVLYQLGSAGLNVEESVEALNSTMNMLVATEGDVTESTKMVAAIYNNFRDQIVGTTKLQEKFQYINDIVVRTFREHQVELNELREGYKHLMAMGKTANLRFVEMSGILATLNDHLIKSGIAGRSVQTILSRISRQPLQFARAFGIAIDPKKPMNFIKILNDIAKRLKGHQLTVEEIGTIFERLGLRGAKSFAILVKHVDELNRNIKDLEENSRDAASEMAAVMMDKPDVAFARLRESLAALVRLGFAPAVKAAQVLAATISLVGAKVSQWDESTRSILGTIIRWVSVIASLKAVSFLVAKLGQRFAGTKSDGETLRLVIKKLASYFKDVGGSIGGLLKAFVAFKGIGIIGWVKNLASAFSGLWKTIFGSMLVMKAFLGVLALTAIYKFVDWLHVSNKEYKELSKNVSVAVEKTKSRIENIKEEIEKQKELVEAQKDYIKALSETLKLKGLLDNFEGVLKEQQKASSKLLSGTKKKIDDLNVAVAGLRILREGKEKFTPETYQKEERRQVNKIIGIITVLSNVYKQAAEQRKELISQAPFIEKFGNNSEVFKSYQLALRDLGVTMSFAKEAVREGTELLQNFEVDFGRALEKIAEDSERSVSKITGAFAELLEKEREAAIRGPLAIARDEVEKAKRVLQEYAIATNEVVNEFFQERGLKETLRKYGDVVEKGVKEILDNVAAYKAGAKFEHLPKEDQRRAVEAFLKALVSLTKAEKQHADTVRSMALSYTNSLNSIRQKIEDLGKISGDYGIFSKIMYIDIDNHRKLISFQKTISQVLDRIKKATKEQAFDFFEAIGLKNVRSIESGIARVNKLFQGLYGRYKNLLDINKEFAVTTAWENYYKKIDRMSEDHKNTIDSIIYKYKKYHTVEEEMAEVRRQNSVKLLQYTRKIEDEESQIAKLEHSLSRLNKEQLQEAASIVALIGLHRKNISNLRELMAHITKLNNITEKRIRLEKEIARLKISQTAYEKMYADMVKYESTQALSFLLKALQKRQEIERRTFEERREELLNAGFDELEIEELRSLMQKRHLEERKYLELQFHRDMLTAYEDRIKKQAELDMRNIKGLKDFWQATLESMKAGSIRFVIENENISAKLADMTYGTLGQVTNAITNMTEMWVTGTAKGAQDYEKVMRNLLASVGKELFSYGLKLLWVWMLQKALGIFNLGGASYTGGVAGTGSWTGVGMFGKTITWSGPGQHGGLLKGGIRGKDSIGLLAMPGEYLIPADAVEYYGVSFFEKLRRKELSKMASGGIVSTSPTKIETRTVDEGRNVNYITIQTNDVNSFRQALYENKDMINSMVFEDLRERGFLK